MGTKVRPEGVSDGTEGRNEGETDLFIQDSPGLVRPTPVDRYGGPGRVRVVGNPSGEPVDHDTVQERDGVID